MVFMNGDNTLEPSLASELDQMEMVGSTSAVNVIVLFARESTNDARVYYIGNGSLTTEADWGSTDMGDPQSLQRFIVYVAANYPAQHYALVLDDHGGGSIGGVSQDYLHGYHIISVPGLKTALGNSGIHFDVIAFDACLMAMVEVAYEIRGYGDYMTASVEEELGTTITTTTATTTTTTYTTAWNYRGVLTYLAKDPQMSGLELSNDIVQLYAQGQEAGWPYSTESAIDLSQMSGVASAVSDFARVLTIDLPKYRNQIRTDRNNTDNSINANATYYADLYDFAIQIIQDSSISDMNLKSASTEVIYALQHAVIACWDGPGHSRSRGLYIYFDKSASSYAGLASTYRSLDFASQTTWNVFLLAYAVAIVI
jgi:hypothetical protein